MVLATIVLDTMSTEIVDEDHRSAQSEVHFQMVLKYSFDPIRPRFGQIQTRFGQIQLFKFEGPKQYLRGHGVPRDGRKDHRSGH